MVHLHELKLNERLIDHRRLNDAEPRHYALNVTVISAD